MSDKVLIHDISYHQGDLTKYWPLFHERGCKAVICQSTNGLAYQAYYRDTAPIIKAQGFLLGSYHYYRQHIPNIEGTYVSCSPTKQAENYYNWVMKSGIPLDLPPALDVENGGNPYGVGTTGVLQCLQHIEKLFGRRPIVYTSPSVASGFAKAGFEVYPLWLAHYTTEDRIMIPKPWTQWAIWQYSDRVTYTPPGSTVKKPIDHNLFNGTEEELKQFCLDSGGSVEPPPPAPDPPPAVPATHVIVTASNFLRLRSEPRYRLGITTLIVEKNQILKIAGKAELEADSGIQWLPVYLPPEYITQDGNTAPLVGYVSKKYTREIK